MYTVDQIAKRNCIIPLLISAGSIPIDGSGEGGVSKCEPLLELYIVVTIRSYALSICDNYIDTTMMLDV